MSQQVTVTARGLFLAPNDLGNVPDGALAQADNAVISKDGVVEQRRGMSVASVKGIVRIFPWKNYQVGWAASGVLSRSTDNGATWADYSGTYAGPGVGKVRAIDASGNLYFTTSTGPYRLDSFTGTPEPAGIPGGLDVQSQMTTAAGTAIPANTKVAYRVVWGKRDANGNLLLGAPSGRNTVTNPGQITIAIGSLVRVTNVVTATLSAGATHTYQVGNVVTKSGATGADVTAFPDGSKTITAITATTFSYAETAADATSVGTNLFIGPTKDVTVTATIPQGLPTGAFMQAYRSPNSQSDQVEPDDNLGLVYEGTPPASATTTQFSRTGSTVTVTTSAAHGYQVGEVVRVPSAAYGSGVIVAVGTNVAATSADGGATWTARTIPAGDYTSVAWNGTKFCAVGNSSACATSPDGVTWSAQTGLLNLAPGSYKAIAWNGSVFCAVGVSSVCATSADGITWAARTISAGNWYGVAWSGSIFAAVGDQAGANPAASSPDGTTWTARTLSFGILTSSRAAAVQWAGTYFVAVGYGTHGGGVPYTQAASWTSADAITWSATTYVPSDPTTGAAATSVAAGNLLLAESMPWTSTSATTWLTRSAASGANAVLWCGANFISVGSSTARTSPDGITWTARTIPAGVYAGLASNQAAFSLGEKTLLTVPTTTTFTYAENGIAGTASSSQALVPLTIAFTDTIPSSFLGAALYTNPNQGTLAASADRISLCQDIASFRGFTFAANITYPSRAFLYLLSVNGSGVVSGDTITIDGLVYTADASVESVANRTFIAYSSGTPAQNIANTAQSLIRVINRSLSGTVTAKYLSGPDDVPGFIYLEENGIVATMTLAFSRSTAWSIQSLKGPENRKNELRWSSSGQPDAMPLLNAQSLGSLDKPISAIRATRDMLVIVKDDGIWRLTGWNGIWDIQPLDPTMGSPAPETLVAFENAIFGVLDSGVARLTESGVEMISTPIYSALEPLLAPAAEATLNSTAFGLAYHSAHKYILWLPSAAGDTVAKQAYVYDSWTNAWTRWVPPTGVTGWAHGMLNLASSDDRTYMLDGTSVYAENKALTASDLHDVTTTAIPFTVKYCPKFGGPAGFAGPGGNPGQLHHFQEVALFFRSVQFTTATVGFSTNLSPVEETVTLTGSDYGVNVTPGTQTTIRVLVPLEKARGSQLNVRFTHSEANSLVQLQGISVVYRPGSTRVGR